MTVIRARPSPGLSQFGVLGIYVIWGVMACSKGMESDPTLDPIMAELASVCTGMGVDHASLYDASEFNPIVIVETTVGGAGQRFGWSYSLPRVGLSI